MDDDDDLDLESCRVGEATYVDFETINEAAQRSTCKIEENGILGSGFLAEIDLNDRGYISGLFTNFHVLGKQNEVEDGKVINILFRDQRVPLKCGHFFITLPDLDVTFIPIPIREVKSFLDRDIAFAKLDFKVAKSDTIFVLQYPKGGKLALSIANVLHVERDHIDHDAPTDKGSSGSPIFNRQGKVVGIHRANIKSTGKNRGIRISSVVKLMTREYNLKTDAKGYLYKTSIDDSLVQSKLLIRNEDGDTRKRMQKQDSNLSRPKAKKAARERHVNKTYTISIMTGDKLFAGTDAGVNITLHGDKCLTEKLELKPSGGKFKKGLSPECHFDLPDIGDIHKIRLSHAGEKWFVEKVKVECDHPKTKWEFSVQEWIGRGKGLSYQTDYGVTTVTNY